MQQADSPCSIYVARRDDFAQRASRLAQTSYHVSILRLIVALVAAICLAGAFWEQTSWQAALLTSSAVAAAGFIALVVYHRRVANAQARFAELSAINAQSIARIERDWNRVPVPAMPASIAMSPFAADLDLFGPRSLFHLIAQPASPPGRRTLAQWLLSPAEPADVAARQQSVAALSAQLDLRQECARLGGRISRQGGEAEPFLEWAESAAELTKRRALVWISRVLPVLLVVFAALQLAGVVQVSLWLLVVAVNISISFFTCRRIHQVFQQISANVGQIKEYVKLFEAAAACQGEACRLTVIRNQIGRDAHSAIAELRRLGRIMDLADLRFSQVHIVVQALTLWDIHVLALAERWKARSGPQARGWFAAIGEFEALASLAGLRHDNPDWCFATMVDPASQPAIVAEALAHPLLAGAVRVANNVSVGPPGTFLLVTGSNMSGKSTLLRSVGVNVVLAQAGGPVCACALSLPPLSLGTSIRVQDSLGDGVSLFLAELKRLKQIVDLASEKRPEGAPLVLYLLDEILHGTNTAERQIAVRRVMSHLVAQRAIGAISTHDLALADVEPLASRSRAVHFQESYRQTPAGRQMTFDYRLRPGVATSTNALALLEMVGLDVDHQPSNSETTSDPN